MQSIIDIDILKKLLPGDDVLSQCIHCGMCLSTCPTYDLTKSERSSPRGRIKLIKSVASGELPVTKVFADEMNFCLDCQACETACPAGVEYGKMVEAARSIVDVSETGNTFQNFLKKNILKHIVASRKNLKTAARVLFFYRISGLQKIIRKLHFLELFSKKLAEVEKMSPEISNNFSDKLIPEIYPSKKEKKYRTAFLTGCLMNVMFADINIDTVEVLSLLGCEVVTPKKQLCCGSLSAHNGDIKTAVELAKKNIDIFSVHEYDFLISNSAGCGAFMKQYGSLLQNDPEYRERAENFSLKVKDLTEFIAENDFDVEWGAVDETITYHDACHLVHSQKVFDQPRKVLKMIPELKLEELNESTWCCGSAGIYNILRYDDSVVFRDRKIKNIINSKARTVVTGNPGCISQIKNGADKAQLNVKVIHPATLLRRSLTKAKI